MSIRQQEALHCAECGCFVGEDALQGIDWSAGMGMDGDYPWTEDYYCAPGKGCNRDALKVRTWIDPPANRKAA